MLVPLVSVVIPTKNSGKTLEKCLQSIKKQSYPNCEILVVDNFSTDQTGDIAARMEVTKYSVWPERTQQKNYGISQAKGEYICFIDSDMELESGVIAECVESFQKSENIGGICIPEDSVGEGFFVKIRAFERGFYLGTSIESARFFRTEDVKSVGGFESDLIFFEESLLPQKIESRLKVSCKHRIEALIHHNEGVVSLVWWLKKKYYYGKSLGEYSKKTRDIGVESTAKTQINILSRYTLFLGQRRFYTHPLLAIGVLTLKTAEFIAGGLGHMIRTLQK